MSLCLARIARQGLARLKVRTAEISTARQISSSVAAQSGEEAGPGWVPFGGPDAALLSDPSTAVPVAKSASSHLVRGSGAVVGDKLMISNTHLSNVSRDLLSSIDLMVCDMAGTTVDEGGVVYETLQNVMNEDGMHVTVEAMHPWHGAKKEAVIEHFARIDKPSASDAEVLERIIKIGDNFLETVTKVYFSPDSQLRLIRPTLRSYFTQLRRRGVKVALDTGYPPEIQVPLVEALGMDSMVDSYVSSYQVSQGRPYPYMIHTLMERLNIMDVKRVCKVGDSVRDIQMGKNAGCGLVVGVLSGADSAEDMLAAGADIIADSVCDLPIPDFRAELHDLRLPDLS